ncbi:FtsX-like permease family protein [bacterium]|nr:FtsX-like permease family protein [bacterium]
MRTRWRKTVRDLLQNIWRSLMVVLAIAIGLSGFSSLLSTYSILTRELNEGYLATNPASATLWTDRIDDALSAELRRFPEVAQLEERRMLSARVRVGPNEWRNALLFVIKDFNNIRVNTLKPQKGKWPAGNGEILIERDAVAVARTKIGASVIVKTAKGTEQSLRVTGTVHDVGQAQARMEQIVYGYITFDTLSQLGEVPYLNQWKIIVTGNRFNEEHVDRTISQVKMNLESKGARISRMEIPKPGKHPHADLMGTLLLFKSSFGLFALLLSGLLVTNLISALMAGQVRQIGVMKAIGATSRQVTQIYIGGAIILGLIALMIAIPLGIFAGRALADFMSRFLNFDLQSYAISPWVFVLEVAIGLFVPLVASAFPVYRGSRVTVLEAISDYGIPQSKFGTGWTDKMILQISGIARPLLLSIRNTFRRRARLALTLGTLAAGGAIFLAACNVRASFIHTIDLLFHSLQYDLTINFAELYPIQRVEQIMRNTPGVHDLESWGIAEAVVIHPNGSQGNPFPITAPPSHTKMLALNIVDGRGLEPGDTNALIVNNALIKAQPALRTGATVLLRIGEKRSTWRIVGLARQPFTGASAYTNYNYFSEASGQAGRTRNVRVITDKNDKKSVDEIKRNLEQQLAAAGLRTTSLTSMAERRHVIDEHNSVIYTFLIVLALLIVVVGGLGLMTLMSINVLERRREIGVLRAIGATRKKVLLMILTEGSLIGALSWILAILAGTLISNPLGNFVSQKMFRTELDSAVDIFGIFIWLLITLLFGALASFLPAWNASRSTVRELVEYE